MKLLIKFLWLSLLITTPILSMDGEHKKTQAALDKQQFLSEQDSKIRAAQSNGIAQDRAPEQLQQEENAARAKDLQIVALDDKSAEDIRAWMADGTNNKLDKIATLPDHILHSILEFCCGDPKKLKFIAQNMEKLIPAVIQWPSNKFFLFQAIDSCKNNSLRTDMYRHNGNCSWGSDFGIVSPAEVLSYKNEPNSFVAYRLREAGKEKQIFKVCGWKFNLLNGLSSAQLELLVRIYDLRLRVLEESRERTFDVARINHKANQEEMVFYDSLPEQIRTCLQHNYGSEAPDVLPMPHVIEIRKTNPSLAHQIPVPPQHLAQQNQGENDADQEQDQAQNQNNGEAQ